MKSQTCLLNYNAFTHRFHRKHNGYEKPLLRMKCSVQHVGVFSSLWSYSSWVWCTVSVVYRKSFKIANQIRNFLSLTFPNIRNNLCSLYNTNEIFFSIISYKFINPKDRLKFSISTFIWTIYLNNNKKYIYNF